MLNKKLSNYSNKLYKITFLDSTLIYLRLDFSPRLFFVCINN